DRDIPIYQLQTLGRYLDQNTEQPRLSVMLLAVFGGLALLLAIVGIYGVLSYTVSQRRQEIGIRMALGASRGDVMRLIVGHGVTPEIDKAQHLRALHHGPPMLVLPNAWDAATARIVEAEGFPAVATTSAGVAAALGYNDGGAVPAREMIEAVARIARAVSVPVTADIEHAYGSTPDAVAETVMRVVAAGAVGINLEDIVPGAADLEPIALQANKITRIIKASTTAGVRVVINARTDVFLKSIGPPETRLAAAIERGKA